MSLLKASHDLMVWMESAIGKMVSDCPDEIYDPFQKAVRAEEAATPKISEWISIKDRLPDRAVGVKYSEVPCLVYQQGDTQVLMFNHEHMCWDDRSGDDFYCKIGDVSHWMPLPKAPSPSDKGGNQ